jgi:regulator of replication initiation timing
MTEAQHALILKHQANTPSSYHHIINHLVLTEQYHAANLLVATLEQEATKKDAVTQCIKRTEKTSQISRQYVGELIAEVDKLQREVFMSQFQAEGFRTRMEQLLEENAKLRAV